MAEQTLTQEQNAQVDATNKVPNPAVQVAPDTGAAPYDTGSGELDDGTTFVPPNELGTGTGQAPITPSDQEQPGTTQIETPTWQSNIIVPDDAVWEALTNEQKIIQDQQANLWTNLEQQKADEAAAKKEREWALNQFQTDTSKILDDRNKQLDALAKEQELRAKEVLDRQNKLLQEKADESTARLEREKEKQRLQDEETLKLAEIQNDVAAQRAAWAFNKLWLWFSSWAILQSQNYATQWAMKLAQLKFAAGSKQKEFEESIANTKREYAELINGNIDKYNDIIADNKKQFIERYNDTALDKLKTSEEIAREKDKIATEFRKTVRDLERQFNQDQRDISEWAVENADNIRKNQELYKEQSLKNLEDTLATWELDRMTSYEKRQMEQELGLPTWFIDTKVNQWVGAQMKSLIKQFAWEWYYPENLNQLIWEVRKEMETWSDFETAVNDVFAREKARNPELKKAIDDNSARLDIDRFKAETDRMDVLSKINAQNLKNQIEAWEFEDLYGKKLTFNTSAQWMRTDRHNNPAAFTTQIAKQAWLVEWVDYVVWDAFPDNPNMFTAKLIWDPFEQTIKVIDKIWFTTQSWANRWTHTTMSKEQWDWLSIEDKKKVVASMYQKEWWNGSLLVQNTTTPETIPVEETDLLTSPIEDISKNLPNWVTPLLKWAEDNWINIDYKKWDTSDIVKSKIINSIKSFKSENTPFNWVSMSQLREQARALWVSWVDNYNSYEELSAKVSDIQNELWKKQLKENPTTAWIEQTFEKELFLIPKFNRDSEKEFEDFIRKNPTSKWNELRKNRLNSAKQNLKSIYLQLRDVVWLNEEQIYTYLWEVLKKWDYWIIPSYNKDKDRVNFEIDWTFYNPNINIRD